MHPFSAVHPMPLATLIAKGNISRVLVCAHHLAMRKRKSFAHKILLCDTILLRYAVKQSRRLLFDSFDNFFNLAHHPGPLLICASASSTCL